jgi:hypothetical protein
MSAEKVRVLNEELELLEEVPLSWKTANVIRLLIKSKAAVIPRKHAVLIPKGKPLTREHILDANEDLDKFKDQGVILVDRRTLPVTVLSSELLASRLSHIHVAARDRLLGRLKQFPPSSRITDGNSSSSWTLMLILGDAWLKIRILLYLPWSLADTVSMPLGFS